MYQVQEPVCNVMKESYHWEVSTIVITESYQS